jgi:hypothetical protein
VLVTNKTHAHAHVLFKVDYFEEKLNCEGRKRVLLSFSINCCFYKLEHLSWCSVGLQAG